MSSQGNVKGHVFKKKLQGDPLFFILISYQDEYKGKKSPKNRWQLQPIYSLL